LNTPKGMLPGGSPSPDDRAALEAFLADTTHDHGAMTYRELLGFFFALACAPEMVPPSEWIPFVFGGDGPTFDEEPQAQQILTTLMGLYNEVNTGVFERDVSLPPECPLSANRMANLEPGAPIGEWCRGFQEGHLWLEDIWESSLPADLFAALRIDLVALMFFASPTLAAAVVADEGAPFESLEEAAEVFGDLFEESMASYASLGRSIHEALFRESRDGRLPNEPYHAPEPIGRNDPCPCGSSKKFKKCCGKNVH